MPIVTVPVDDREQGPVQTEVSIRGESIVELFA